MIGIKELSAPRSHLNATTEEACEMIIQTKLYRQSWGPEKVLAYLRDNGPQLHSPADATTGEILKRAGLVKRRIRRYRVSPYSEPLGTAKNLIRSGVRI